MKKASTKKLSDKKVYRRSEDVVTRTNADGSLSLLHLKIEDLYFTLDGFGPLVWTAIDGKKSLATIKEKLRPKISVPDSTYNKGFEKMISDLASQDLIT
jgi:hypothetical protein